MSDYDYSFTDYISRDEFADLLDEASSGMDAEYMADQFYDSDEPDVDSKSVKEILTEGVKRFDPRTYLQVGEV